MKSNVKMYCKIGTLAEQGMKTKKEKLHLFKVEKERIRTATWNGNEIKKRKKIRLE